VLKTLGLRRNDETYHQAPRFWARSFGINTNWSHFSRFAGGVIGLTLGMEGMFAFFLESAFLSLFLYGVRLNRGVRGTNSKIG
jgi:cytochrome d ubiquinol oxidase subunit I